MPSKTKLLYWDSCIFLAWLKDEERAEGEMSDLASVVEEIEKGNFSVATSVITIAEILTGRSGEEVVDKFKKLFDRSNFQMINVDDRIATKASEIRNLITLRKQIKRGSNPLSLPIVSIWRLLSSLEHTDFIPLMVAIRN